MSTFFWCTRRYISSTLRLDRICTDQSSLSIIEDSYSKKISVDGKSSIIEVLDTSEKVGGFSCYFKIWDPDSSVACIRTLTLVMLRWKGNSGRFHPGELLCSTGRMFRGNTISSMEVPSVHWRLFSTVGDTIQYFRGYHLEFWGILSLLRGISFSPLELCGDNTQNVCGFPQQYWIFLPHSTEWYPSTVLCPQLHYSAAYLHSCAVP